MRRRFNRTQRNYIIIGLCAILVIMGVGYAAFQSQLKISGTSNVTSNWNVRITNIQSKNIVGSAGNSSEPTYTDTTATFNATLQSPGDSISYDVTVSNQGSIDAKLDKITMTDSSNSAIIFETSGIKEGDLLAHGETATLTVKVSYNSGVTSQPENLSATLKITLDYSQAEAGYVPPAGPILVGGQSVEVVTSGDGLYSDEYETGKYTYKGANPNNYITFNNETWRIVSIDSNGLIKIIRNESIGNMAWDTAQTNSWDRPSSLNTYLNENYLNSLIVDKNTIVDGTYGIGEVIYNNSNLSEQIIDESEKMWTGKIGLLTVSEYLRANTNTEQCGNLNLNNTNYLICKTTNWIYKIVPNNNFLWLISYVSDERNIFSISNYLPGAVSAGSPANQKNVFPVLYLKSTITLDGQGTISEPYTIS